MKNVRHIYYQLYENFGNLGWWPGDSPDEVIIGAILTQNTSWNNVEKSLSKLKKANLLSIGRLRNAKRDELAELIRSSGFFNQKSERLIVISREIIDQFGSLEGLRKAGLERATFFLSGLNGIGKETLDSILLYALDFPKFVIDSYTIRIFSRIGLTTGNEKSDEIQGIVESELCHDVDTLKNFHGMIVELAKQYCRKKPLCKNCPVKDKCSYYEEVIVP